MDVSPPLATYDMVMSFMAEDKDFSLKLAEDLKKEKDFSVWCPTDSRHRKHTAEAIVDSKVFIVIMTAKSAVDQQIRDEVALAYITGSIIIPVGRQMYPDVSKNMGSAMLLTLAKINWCFFMKDDDYEDKLERFLSEVTEACENSDTFFTVTDIKESVKSEYLHKFEYSFNRQVSVKRQESYTPRSARESAHRGSLAFPSPGAAGGIDMADGCADLPDFWDRHWGATHRVVWEDFWLGFLSDYQVTIETALNTDFVTRFHDLMGRDIFEGEDVVEYTTYRAFCGFDGSTTPGGFMPCDGDLFFNCVRDYTIGYFAIREVFKMESSVRMAAIQNLMKFQTPSVIASLCDLTEDEEANIRAIAAIGLGRAGKWTTQVEHVLNRILTDEDCYVRQSACLTCALLHKECMIPMVSDRWRDDPICKVREAAEIALNHIGGIYAQNTVSITKKLTKEMGSLTAK